MFKKRIEKVLMFLKETLISETAESKQMLKVYLDYTKGEASARGFGPRQQTIK